MKKNNEISLCSLIYKYNNAIDIKEKNKIINIITKSKDASIISIFALRAVNAPVDYLADKVIKTKDISWISFFAYHVRSAPFKKLIEAHIKILSENALIDSVINKDNFKHR